MELDDKEAAEAAAINAAWAFGEACAAYRDADPYRRGAPLDMMMNTLMTELWDRCFSQTEIRAAFQSALDDMNRYAAGQERRS